MTVSLPLALDPYLRDWLDLLLRWLHVIAAMAWIGTSFYFVLLDQTLRTPKDQADVEAGVFGEEWEVHGGGFYHVQKYRVAPRDLPEHLAWFKWEAYTTWLSGFGLMLVLYYLEADSTMIDPGVADLHDWGAVVISVSMLAGAWVGYDIACRLFGRRPWVLWPLLGGLVALTAWGSSELFAARAAWIQVGAMIGTVMAANVFLVIIPSQRELVRAKREGDDPDPAPGIKGKQRSVHNNYLTLPVLVTMLAGHFSFVYGLEHAWLVLVALMLLGAWARVFFNLRHTGRTHWWMPIVAAAAVIALAVAVEPDGEAEPAAKPTIAALAQGKAVFAASCGGCHALAAAGTTGAVGPNLDGASPSRELVEQRATDGQGAMPSFKGTLSDDEIAAVAAYVSSTAGK